MAKQIYIDENGNEQLVSGTINNASLLPISASDTTNTKDYIDTGLSGKENSITYESDDYDVTTYGGVIRCKKWGRIVNVQGYAIGSVQAPTVGSAYTFATIASKYRPNPQQHVMGFSSASSYKYDGGQGYRINTDGTVVAYVYSGTNLNNGYFNVTYMV